MSDAGAAATIAVMVIQMLSEVDGRPAHAMAADQYDLAAVVRADSLKLGASGGRNRLVNAKVVVSFYRVGFCYAIVFCLKDDCVVTRYPPATARQP